MLHLFGMGKTAIFATGAVVGLVGGTVLKSEAVRNVAVKGLAKGMIVKDSVISGLANLKEDAEDICAEAREEARNQVKDADFQEFEDTDDQDNTPGSNP